jgi:pantoate--beta-alanine ligase
MQLHESGFGGVPVIDVVKTCDDIRDRVHRFRCSGQTVGLVPTMGALHQGHLSLVRESLTQCDRTIVSIFVNPTQFGPDEDLSSYPRTLDADLDLLRQIELEPLGTNTAPLVFCPHDSEMYPDGYSTSINPPAIAKPWEGQFRPSHFGGVATVVLKLFAAAPADIAFFGRKDYQQFRVIDTMVRDLNLGIAVQACPIVREIDGLAMSSRNRYLSSADRVRALALSQALNDAKASVDAGNRNAADVREKMLETLKVVDSIDYAAVVDVETLQPTETIVGNAIAMIAATVGRTRLIDNCVLTPTA